MLSNSQGHAQIEKDDLRRTSCLASAVESATVEVVTVRAFIPRQPTGQGGAGGWYGWAESREMVKRAGGKVS